MSWKEGKSWDRSFFLWLMTPEKKKARTLLIPESPDYSSFQKIQVYLQAIYDFFILGTFSSSLSISVNILVLLSPFIFLLVGFGGGGRRYMEKSFLYFTQLYSLKDWWWRKYIRTLCSTTFPNQNTKSYWYAYFVCMSMSTFSHCSLLSLLSFHQDKKWKRIQVFSRVNNFPCLVKSYTGIKKYT